ncbi:MAG: ferritin-like domain-containing protein [Campylobacterales bacterium]|nr:ferritin-like domain-containing protein [Campylobacterales bacterium]
MNFFKQLEIALCSDDVETKKQITTDLLAYCTKNDLDFVIEPKSWERPSYHKKCVIVAPQALPKRNRLDTNEGLGKMVHAITHIEYCAIDLALDAVYRFGFMPREFLIDWLVVAEDEIRHFVMLQDILHELGFAYGDFAVHQGFFEIAKQTENSVIDRMAVVPRYYEANGLDVNPQIVKKLENRRKERVVSKMIEALYVILEEEIDHVKKGDKWFSYSMQQKEGIERDCYFEILKKYNLLEKHRPHINVQARKRAGFSCEEIKILGAKEC